MTKTNFIVKNKQKMFSVLQCLQQEAKLVLNQDCGVEILQAGTPGSTSANFWISSEKINTPLVKKVLIQNNLR